MDLSSEALLGYLYPVTKIAPQAPKHQDFGQIRLMLLTTLDFVYLISAMVLKGPGSYWVVQEGICYPFFTRIDQSQIIPHRMLALLPGFQFSALPRWVSHFFFVF